MDSSGKILRNSNELLVLMSLVEQQDIGKWSQQNRDSLRQIYEQISLTEDNKAHVTKFIEKLSLSCFNSDVNEEQQATNLELTDMIKPMIKAVPDMHLGDLRKAANSALFSDIDVFLDLTRRRDIKIWWALRKYVLLDFKDESCIMDYCSACTLMLLVCFVVIGFVDYTIQKQDSNGYTLCVMKRSAGLLMASGIVSILTLMFVTMMQACVTINQLLEQDSCVLMSAAYDVSADESKRGVKETDNEVKETDNEATAAHREKDATLNLLWSLDAQVTRFDDQQTLFGYPITANLRNALAVTIFYTLLDYAWRLIHPFLQNVDMDALEEQVVEQ
jgi:hypothetical protein